MSIKGCIISERKLPDQFLLDLRVALLTSKVEQAAMCTKTNVTAIFVIKILCDMLKHHAKELSVKRCRKNTALFHAICDIEGS